MKILLLGDRKIENYKKVLEYLNVPYGTLDNHEAYENYDGLIVPGGIDVCPKFYNEEKDPSVEISDEAFDKIQFEVIDYFVKSKKKILGICRGLQLLNVYFKGSLIQDIKSDIKHRTKEENEVIIHSVNCDEGFLKELYGSRFNINSSHHQAIKKPGNKIRIIAKADDGIIEAFEHESLPIIGVQFHPERMTLGYKSEKYVDGIEIFKYFLKLKNGE